MNSDWPVVRLGCHIESSLGKMLDAKKNRGIEQPYLGNSNVRWGRFDLTSLATMRFESHENAKYGLRSGDLIVCEGGEPGRCAVWKDEIPNMKIQKALHRVRPKDTLNCLYLFYWFLYANSQGLIEPYFTGTTIKHLTGKALKELQIPLPPINHQKLVAKTLGTVDDRIQLNYQINQTLESMAQAIFKSWFVDFDPVRAKMAALEAGGSEEDALLAAMQAISGKDPEQLAQMADEQPEEYAELKTTAGLFPSAMQDSELGEIPKGWDIVTLSDVIDLIGGGTPKKSEPLFWSGDICWFSVRDTPTNGNVFVIETQEKITELGLKRSSTKLLPIGTTIITARGTVGKLALTGIETAMNQSCYGVVSSDGSGSFFNYLRMRLAVDRLKRNTHGAVFDTITQSTFQTVTLPQSDLDLRNRFETIIAPLFNSIKQNAFQSKTLEQIRDTLLPKLLSGELTVSDLPSIEILETGDV